MPTPFAPTGVQAVLPATGPVAASLTTARFNEVYEKHIQFVWRNVRRLGVPEASTDDVVQSVLLVIFRRLDTFQGRSSVNTWIYEIIVRVVRDYRRSTRRKSPLRGDGWEATDPSLLEAPPEHGPEALADRAAAARLVRDLLDTLDDDKREVFVLAELEMLAVREIAEILHEPEGTIASRLRAARGDFERAARRQRARDERRLRWTT